MQHLTHALFLLKPEMTMLGTAVLAPSWSDYEERKMSENEDANIFCPEHPWELNYLIRKIREQHDQYTETAVFLSIRSATRSIPAPRKRTVFVNHVVHNLLQREPCLLV